MSPASPHRACSSIPAAQWSWRAYRFI